MRTRLVVLVGLPAVLLVALTVLQSRTLLRDHSELVTARHDLAVGIGAADVADALHHERDAVISMIGRDRADPASLLDSIQRTDNVTSSLSATADDRAALTPAVRTALASALIELDGLKTLRQTIRQTRYPDLAALARYSQILNQLSQVGQAVAESTSTLPIATTVATVQALCVATDQLTFQNSVVLAAAHHADLLPQQADDLRAAQARFDAAAATVTGQADPRARQHYLDTVSGADVDERNRLVQRTLIESAKAEPITALPDDIARAGDATAERLRTVRRDLSAEASARLETVTEQAWRSAALAIVAAVAMLMATFGAALLMSLSLSRPLRLLRRTALWVADHGLPEAVARILADPNPQLAAQDAVDAVPVHTTEEVGQVARSFDAVHGVAVRLAVEQAALRDNVNSMFVNLSRRSQSLVERQLAMIDRLEQDEQDPDQLASLFELDHLATRLRRNSENLLVLAGTDLSSRPTRPVPVAEVMGAAVSEVEQYARIETRSAPEVTVQGRAVKDLVHLVAELLDNATAFSGPVTKVSLRTVLARDGRLAVEILDHGVGMTAQELLDANESLADPPEVNVEVSRRMGLYVVARLAKRHGISVRLRTNEDTRAGTAALVVVPANLIEHPRAPAPVVHSVPLPLDSVGGLIPATQAPVDLFQPQTPVEVQPYLVRASIRAQRRRSRTAPTGPGVVGGRGSTGNLPPLPLARHLQDEAAQTPVPRAATPTAVEIETVTLQQAAADDRLSEWFQAARASNSKPSAHEQSLVHPRRSADSVLSRHEDTTAGMSGQLVESDVVRRVRPHPRQRRRGDSAWSSGSDAGWNAARQLLTPSGAEHTDSGLPKRVPQARLIPGAAGPPSETGHATPHTSRDAETARDRLGSYQRGVHRGRHERIESHRARPASGTTDEKESE